MVSPLKAEHISKRYGTDLVLDELSLELHRNETLSILGRSGCGKTTLLKILAGLESPDSGRVFSQETDLQAQPAHRRDIVYLYQEALLFPHLTAYENIAFGLRLRGIEDEEIRARTEAMFGHLRLEGMQQKMPHQLSGGEQQRVSFGRALITNPKVLLLDEPFGNLDADTRDGMQQLFREVARQFEITAIFVTHNLKEAILMGDRIATLDQGRLSVYASIEQFIASGDHRVREEIRFWENLS